MGKTYKKKKEISNTIHFYYMSEKSHTNSTVFSMTNSAYCLTISTVHKVLMLKIRINLFTLCE